MPDRPKVCGDLPAHYWEVTSMRTDAGESVSRHVCLRCGATKDVPNRRDRWNGPVGRRKKAFGGQD